MDLADMRRAYDDRGLREADLAPTWREQFERWLAEAVAAEVPEPNAMVLATAGTGARPSARTVLLKGVDDAGFVFFTNLDSRKGREARDNPQAAVLFPWIALQRQVVVEGDFAPVAPEAADDYFASRPRGSRLSAAASPQSQVVASRDELEARRRTVAERWPDEVPRPERWGGLRIVPRVVEFWQGRPDRLHDRLRFRRTGEGAWIVERLAP